MLKRTAILLLFCGLPAAQAKRPERKVEGNRIVSEREPKVGIELPKTVKYVGADDQKRKELMIIYGEDLAPTGFTAAELQEGGKARDRWPAIEKDLVGRATQKIAIETSGR